MLVDKSVLYARTIDPVSGRIEKQDTFLYAVAKVIGLSIVFGTLLTAVYWALHFIA